MTYKYLVFEEKTLVTNPEKKPGIEFWFRKSQRPNDIKSINVEGAVAAKAVWLDVMKNDIPGRPVSVYGWLEPDEAEQIGLALIAAARVARGE